MAELRDLLDEERSAYFRGIQPIWGGGLDEGRFLLSTQHARLDSEIALEVRAEGGTVARLTHR